MNPEFESVLVVYQNPAEGQRDTYDDWYTNIHIRDAMRLDGAIATQRFIVADDQPVLKGRRVAPQFWAHTVYEWESAAKSVEGHHRRGGTPLMEISRHCSFVGLRDFFYRPKYLSHGWNRADGFRRGTDVLTALLLPPAGREDSFIDWFVGRHAPDTLATAGFGSIGLFTLHEAQSLPTPAEFPLVAIYGLTDRRAALQAWAGRHDRGSDADLGGRAEQMEIGCWQPRTPRLRAEEVTHPTPEAKARELEARETHKNSYLSREELERALAAG